MPPRQQPVPPRHQIVIVASADVVSGKDPQGRCEIPGVGPIPQSELERLACDAEVFGVLFSGDGEPLWHGRGERTVTDAQRRALLARDGVCVLCAEEPSRCESHHIVPWAKPGEGPTDIDNLALLCGTCHRRLHNHKRVLTRSPDGTWGTAPDPRHAGRRQHPRPRHASGRHTSAFRRNSFEMSMSVSKRRSLPRRASTDLDVLKPHATRVATQATVPMAQPLREPDTAARSDARARISRAAATGPRPPPE